MPTKLPRSISPSASIHRAHAGASVLSAILLVAMMCGAGVQTSVAQAISITESESRPLIDSRREAMSYLSDNTTFGQPDHDALQALAAQSGANQSWDLTAYTYGDPTPFVNFFREFDESTPGFGIPAYENANCVGEALVADNPDLPADNYAYFRIAEDRLEAFGNLTVGFNRIEQTPGDLERQYPVTFGSSWTSDFSRTIVGGPGAAVDVSISNQVDGWGMLRLPGIGEVPALRIMSVTQIGGQPDNPTIRFITEDGVEAQLGFDIGFQVWESVSYTTETITGGGPLRCGQVSGGDDGVLLVVDDASDLTESDQIYFNTLEDLELDVMVVSDDIVATEEADGTLMVVISGSADGDVMTADWSSTAVPVFSSASNTFDDLLLTGPAQNTDFGFTASVDAITIADETHPVANGATGEHTVLDDDRPMNFGVPGSQSTTVATADGGSAVLFTYETGVELVDASGTPARRAAFFMGNDGPELASLDGLILLRNTLLWTLGRDGEIVQTVRTAALDNDLPQFVALGPNYPNPFNPSTTIPFQLTRPEQVSVRVFDALGRHVATLVDASLPRGSHSVVFDAGSNGSGVYIVQLVSGAHVAYRRITLMK